MKRSKMALLIADLIETHCFDGSGSIKAHIAAEAILAAQEEAGMILCEKRPFDSAHSLWTIEGWAEEQE